jgi:outer membrane protein TolC
LAQSPAQQSPAPSTASQIPLSGRVAQPGTVTVNQSTGNSGNSTNSIDIIRTSINIQGSYSGSAPPDTSNSVTLTLTLEKAFDLALHFNLGTITQSQTFNQAQGQARVARSQLLPNFDSTASETVEQLNLRTAGVLEPSFPMSVGPFNFFDVRLARLKQSLFDPVRLHNYRSANELARSASLSARDSHDLVVLAVGASYLQIVASLARTAAASAHVDTSRAIFQQATDRLASGLNARIDVTRSEIQLDTDRQRLRSLQADVERQKLALGRIIGVPPGQNFVITDDYPFTPLSDFTVDRALTTAERQRFDLKASSIGVTAAEESVKAAHAERLPNVAITADYGVAGLRPTAEAHGVFTVSGTLTVPLYEGGRVRGDIQQANASLEARRAELADVRGRIDQEVREAFIDLSEASDQVDLARRNVDLSHDTLQQARDRFTSGIADTIEVVQAQQSVVQAENDYISAVFAHNLAKISLARAVGDAESSIKQFLRK